MMKRVLGLTTAQWKRVFYVDWSRVIAYTISTLIFLQLITFF